MIAEWFQTAWGWVTSIIGGLSFSAILTAIICAMIKGNNNRNSAKLVELLREEAKASSQEAVAEGLGAIKTIVHKHDIEPLVDAKLKNVAKITSEEQTKDLKQIHKDYQQIVKILDIFSSYFDNSFYVSDENKHALKEEIAEAKDEEEPEPVKSDLIDEMVSEPVNTENSPQNESHSTTSIER